MLSSVVTDLFLLPPELSFVALLLVVPFVTVVSLLAEVSLLATVSLFTVVSFPVVLLLVDVSFPSATLITIKESSF